MIGGTIQSVGQVVASATMVNAETTTMATLFKIMRIIMLVFVVLYFSFQTRRTEKAPTGQEGQLKIKRQSFLPWYVLGFIILCSLDTVFQFPKVITETARFISSWCEIIALAAIGLRLNLVEFVRAGRKLAIYGLAVLVFQVGIALALIRLLLT